MCICICRSPLSNCLRAKSVKKTDFFVLSTLECSGHFNYDESTKHVHVAFFLIWPVQQITCM